MKLPHAEHAIIDIAKLRDYLLSDTHPVGRFKSAYFLSLGYTSVRWDELDLVLRALAVEGEADLGEATMHGQKYRVAGLLPGPTGSSASIITAWIVLHEQTDPRFVTAYPG